MGPPLRLNPVWFLLALVACGQPAEDVQKKTKEKPGPELEHPPRNLLLITSDTTRVDHFNLRGYDVRTTTPNLDELLVSGLYLSQHQSCSSWTFASFMCMLTGRDQVHSGHVPDNNNHGDGVSPYPDDSLQSLARILNDQGYGTALIFANQFLSSEYNMNQGHDTEMRSYSALDGQSKAFERLDELAAGTDPWFMHYHFNDAHSMYFAPIEYLDDYIDHPECETHTMNNRDEFNALENDLPEMTPEEQRGCLDKFEAKYDGTLRYMDDYLQQLVDHVDKLGVLGDTLVVIATDHGEEFYDHEGWEHGESANREVVASVAAFIHPEIEPEEISSLTSHEDVLPTILHYMNLEEPPGLTGHLAWDSPPVQHHLTYRNEKTIQAVRTPTEKLIYKWKDRKFFYDLATDPWEQNNLYDPEDPRVIALWEHLLPKVEELAAQVEEDGWAPVNPGP